VGNKSVSFFPFLMDHNKREKVEIRVLGKLPSRSSFSGAFWIFLPDKKIGKDEQV